MSVETVWIIALVAVVVAAVAGYFIGRSGHGSAQERIAELETEVKRRTDELAEYKKEVEAHFDKTSSLFVNMAGSYKTLFEHLSADYERLSDGSAQKLFKERVGALLMDGDAPKALAADVCETTPAPAADIPAAEKPTPVQEPQPSSTEPLAEGGQQTAPAQDTPATEVAAESSDTKAPETGAQQTEAAPTDAPLTEPQSTETAATDVQEPATVKPQPEAEAATETETTLEKAARKRAETEAGTQESSKS